MDRMRKLIAKHMVMSKSISAHVTSFAEADVSKIVEWRNRIKKKFIERETEPLKDPSFAKIVHGSSVVIHY